MSRMRWYHCAKVGGIVWFVLICVVVYDYRSEKEELNPIVVETEPIMITGEDTQTKDGPVREKVRLEVGMIRLKWLKMALLLFLLLVLLPLALCAIEKEDKQKSHAVANLWKWAKSFYLASTILFSFVLVVAFSFRGLQPEEEGGESFIENVEGVVQGEKKQEYFDAKTGVALVWVQWGLESIIAIPFLLFSLLIAYLGYLRFLERSILCGRGKGFPQRCWGAFMSPEETSRDISMMSLPLLVIYTEASLFNLQALLPGQQLVLISSTLSLYISAFIVPVIASLIAKGAVCHILQFKDKDDEDDGDAGTSYISMFEATSKACAAGIVICVPLSLLAAILSMPFVRAHRTVVSLLLIVKSWITSVAAVGLGLIQFNLRRSLVMGDRLSQLLFITSSLSLLFAMFLSFFAIDLGSFHYISISANAGEDGQNVDGYTWQALLIATADILHIFGFSLTGLFAFNRIK